MSQPIENNSSLERSPSPDELVALRWVTRCDRGLSDAEEQEMARWLAESPRHRELFEEFGGTWTLMGGAGEFAIVGAEPTHARPTPEHAHVSSGASQRHGARRLVWTALAAAAALVVGTMMLSRPSGHETSLTTEIGALHRVELPDGSVVRLNTDSALTTAFTTGERRVRLARGEAFFEVAKDPARPFIVEVANVAVRAVGTAFNVRLRTDSVEVLVTEGKVRVAPEHLIADALPTSPEIVHVAAGERVVVPVAQSSAPQAPAVDHVAADEVRRVLAWHDGRLDFSDTPLSEMVSEFNRYHAHKLVIVDPALAATRFGGSFRPEDRVGFVRMLREAFGVQAEERDGETVLHQGR